MSEFGASTGQSEGVEVWRIENKAPAAYPKDKYGVFYEGDAYIVLKTTKKPGYSSFSWDVFFWLGSTAEQAEKGIAAYKTVELDEQILGGAAVQSREVQGHESDEFMACFKSVEYKKGGVDSGFVKVDRDAYDNRLLQLKGSRTVRVNEVPISAASLNAGDVFVFDSPSVIYQWNGSSCNRKEKAKALEVSISIKDEIHGGKADIQAFDQGDEPSAFWDAIGGKGDVAAAVCDSETAARGALKLIKVSDDSGSVKMETLSDGGELSKDLLGTSDVYIVDNVAQIFVWIGKGATPAERSAGMGNAQKYMDESSRPAYTKVTKVMEGAEPPVFKSNFSTWAEPVAAVDFSMGTARSGAVAERARQDSVDTLVKSMAGATVSQDASLSFGAGGTTEMYRIEDFKPVATEAEKFGQFYAGDSYIIKYTYKEGTKECYVIYFWQGAKSSADEKGASALHAKEMDDAVGGAATQVRVVQGKEPAHFVALFGGKMVVHSGGKASGAKNAADEDSYDVDGISLFHVRGTSETNTRAVQVPEKASSLNSGDCFVLATPAKVFLWVGGLANEVESATGAKVAALIAAGKEVETLKEESECDAFWEGLGGKGEYVHAKAAPELDREPSLFQCSNSKGSFQIERVPSFSQGDLEESDVFILDTYTTVFLWIGSEATEVEKEMVKDTADKYVKSAGYSADTAIVTVKSGSEPALFTSNFLGWDPEKSKKFLDPYAAKLAELKAAQEAAAAEDASAAAKADAAKADAAKAEAAKAEAEAKAADEAKAAKAAADAKAAEEKAAAAKAAGLDAKTGFKEPMTYRVPYDELKKDVCPDGVDPSQKEAYLADEEFEKVLGSPRHEFNTLKPWKKQQLKKAVGLF